MIDMTGYANIGNRPRSYRLHFKKWGITRASQLKELRDYTSGTGGRNNIGPDGGDPPEGIGWISGSERAHSLPPEPRPLDTSTEHVRQRLQGLQATTFSSNPDTFWTIGPTFKLESMHRSLRGATESDCREILEQIRFENGQDNVLHYTAMADDAWTLNCIIDFMQSRSLSVDVLSSRRRTSLEIAIQMGRKSNVKLLLDARASLTRRNDNGQQPLHFAISVLADPKICRLLVDRGANVNIPYTPSEHVAISPMHLALERFLESKKDHDKDILCATLQELIDHGAQINLSGTQRETPLIKFIKASTELSSTSSANRQEQIRPSSLLGYYLNADRNPLCWFPKYHCPAVECKSLAAFIFAHTPKSGLSAILIESSDLVMYGLDLVRVLLSPCTMRYSNAEDPTVNELLRDLLQKMRVQNIHGPLPPGLLRQIVDQTPKKKRLERLETLLSSGYVGENESREALTWLNDIDDSGFRLSFAELLLSQFNTALHPAYFNMTAYLFNQKSSRFQDFTDEPQLHERLREEVLPRLEITDRRESEDCIVQCVVHVLTKFMLENKMRRDIAPAGLVIYVASRLRQRYQLPDIPVARPLLLELQYVALQQNKHLSGALGSESAGTPDSYMSDSATCLTPESARS